MTNLIKADFNGTQVLFQNNAYLHATAIAGNFGKKAKDYLRNDRTKDYIRALLKAINSKGRNVPFEENQLLVIKKGSPANGGGTWLHPKLAIDFARWLSAEFAVWCDEQIENILHGKAQTKLDDLSTAQSRKPLKDAVTMMVPKCHLSYSECYKIVHKRFGVKRIEELTNEQVDKATDFVHYLMANNVIEGELLQKDESTDRRIALLLMKKGSMAKAAQTREIERLEDMLFAVREQVNTIKKYGGSISDGLAEAQIRVGFTKEESEGATEEARDSFFARYGKQPI